MLGWKVPFRWGVHFDGGEAAHTCITTDTINPQTAPAIINGLNLCEQAQKADRTTAPNGNYFYYVYLRTTSMIT